MLRRIGLVLLASATLAGPLHAQSVDVPRPYPIPLPPNSNPSPDPQWEVGMRYWWSEGQTRYDFSSNRVSPILGDPTSVLDYDGVNANALEFVWAVRSDSDTVFRGFVGGGWLNGGSLDDEDYFVGQVKFSDTYSRADGDYLAYGTIDLAQDFDLLDGARRVVVSPFIGFNYWQEDIYAYGVRCNPDHIGGLFCGQPGEVVVPYSVEVISNKASWSSLRLGAELRAQLWDRLTVRTDAAILPVAYLWNKDSHYLRTDLGRVHNRIDEGTGWGYQLEGELRLDVADNWAVGAGVRYWYATTDGKTDFFRLNTTVDLNEFTSDRFGVFGNVTYRFATF